MSGIFQFAVRTQAELEVKMTSVERVTYYSDVSVRICSTSFYILLLPANINTRTCSVNDAN